MAERHMEIIPYNDSNSNAGVAWLAMRTQLWVTQVVGGSSRLYVGVTEEEAITTVNLTNTILHFCRHPEDARRFLISPQESKLKTSSIKSMVWTRFAFYYRMLGSAPEQLPHVKRLMEAYWGI